MFGFPTRVRLLYTRLARQAARGRREDDTVERELDIAISQFAPESETVKDKQVHTACGVVELHPLGRTVVSKGGFYPAAPGLFNRGPVGALQPVPGGG